MKNNSHSPIEDWCLRETTFNEENLGRFESLFALSNGLIGMRGTFEEGEPNVLPGTYLNSVFERRQLNHAESAYGYPESSETIINVTDGKLIRLLVEDWAFDMRYGKVIEHERKLDFRSGLLTRATEWESPTGHIVRVKSTRIVSLTQRSIAAIDYEVEAVNLPTRLVLQSELVANELAGSTSSDPRESAVIDSPLVPQHQYCDNSRVGLLHETKRSKLRIATSMDHIIECPSRYELTSDCLPDTGRVTVTTMLQPGQKLRLTKFVGYAWSSSRSFPALRDQAHGAVSMAHAIGWDALCAEQARYLEDFWSKCDIQLDGDEELQQAVRFSMFNMLQASARAERRGVPAKGLTGPGYDGHIFWDQETFLLQALVYIMPEAAGNILRWRQSILPGARERAAQLGHKGAAFPWRTISGGECSGYWPGGTAQFHINADIADAVLKYVHATNDVEFEKSVALELLVETARFWASLGQFDVMGQFRIDGVTGPDEYTAVVDNNVYTNLMAKRNLTGALETCKKYPKEAEKLGVDPIELKTWKKAAESMVVLYDKVLGVHPQSEGFTRHAEWDFKNTKVDQYPLFLSFHYFEIYRKQVTKQADLVLAMQMCPDEFTDEQKLRNFEYYEAITTRDSSLSATSQSILAAAVGCLDLAHDYLAEAALIDLQDVHGNAKSGLHMASMSGTWLSFVLGFGGMHVNGGQLTFKPRLPKKITKLSIGLIMVGRPVRVTITHKSATYSLLTPGPDLIVKHYGKEITLSYGKPMECALPDIVHRSAPASPYGKTPASRRQHLAGIKNRPSAPNKEPSYSPYG